LIQTKDIKIILLATQFIFKNITFNRYSKIKLVNAIKDGMVYFSNLIQISKTSPNRFRHEIKKINKVLRNAI